MNIYIPFTYIIGWSQHKKFYYGAKYAQGCQPSDLWESYFTSSEYVEEFRKEFGEPNIIKIHRIFSDANSCVLFEHQYLTKIDAKNNDMFLNKSNGGKFNNSKMCSAKIVASGEVIWVSVEDPRWKTGEIIGCLSGKCSAIEVYSGTFINAVSTEDPRWKTGEIIHYNKGLSPARLVSTKEIIQVSTNDPRWKTGEIVGIHTGNTVVINISTGEKFSVSKNDLRLKSGEIAGHTIGKCSARVVLTGETIQTDKEDPRWKTGEIVGVNKGYVSARIVSTGETLQVSKSDPRWKTGEIISANKGNIFKTGKCKYCEKVVAVHSLTFYHNDNCPKKPGNENLKRTKTKKQCPNCQGFFSSQTFKKYHGKNCLD